MADVYEQDGELVLIHNSEVKVLAGIGTSSSQYLTPFTYYVLKHAKKH